MKKISKYQLFTELQHGPITRVYKAIQPELQRVVLVKQLNPDLVTDDELVARFKQEGLILAKINSPHVITIFDFGIDKGIPFLVTEFIEGDTLAELIQQTGPVPWDISLFILQQLAKGLAAIHHRDIIHQDIKPENIFISNEGEVKLGDLGFSISLKQADQQIQGTPAYLPPEMVLGSSIDFRSDLYSLGLVGYEMLTGENPFAAEEMHIILNRIINLKPMTVHAVRTEVPEQLSTIIVKLMAKNPEERVQSTQEFYQELETLKITTGVNVAANSLVNFLQEPDKYQISQVIPGEKIAQPAQTPKKRKRAILTVGLLAIAILVVLLLRSLNDGFSFLPEKPDTTRTANRIKYNEKRSPKDTFIVSADTENVNKPEIIKSTESLENLIDRTAQKDSLEIVTMLKAKQDSIFITSDPRAVVLQNGDSLGITPFTLILDSKKDPMEIEFQTPGFPIIKKTVTISELTAQKFHINLWQEVGYLDVSIIPWGEIWIDGDSVDVSPISRHIILSPGYHRLTVRHPTLRNETEPFYVAVGETLKKEIHLQRRP